MGISSGFCAGLQNAFTLVELLVVVAILAVTAGVVVVLTATAGRQTDEQMVQAECAEIRKAAIKFKDDMGELPRFLAELIQPPDPADAAGGWWWRTDGTPSTNLRTYDPAVRRGWNGPYLRFDFISRDTQETSEGRQVGTSTYEQIGSNLTAGRRLCIPLSRYVSYPQSMNASRPVSHYQMDYSDPNAPAVRFVRDPQVAPAQMQVVAKVSLGPRQ